MRRIFALLALTLVWMGGTAVAAPQIAVDLATYNFPDTVEGIAVVYTFVLSNVGDQELVIASAKPGCVCTTAELSTDRLQPGQSGEVRAVLDTEGIGRRPTRYITVKSNDPFRPTITLYLTGNVAERQPYQKSVSDLYHDAYLLLDVREPAAYAAGHLLGAMNVPASQSAAYAAGLPPGALTIFYDQNGSTVSAVSQALGGGGVAAVYALRGGLDQWQRSYGSASLVAGSDASWGAFLDVSGARAYSASGALKYYDVSQLRSDYVVLVDIRPASAFAAGHLAGAVNLSEASVSAFIDSLPREIPVIVYSGDGADSDRVVYGLWVRGSRAQSLLGGLAEWQKQHGNFLVVSSAG
jgi:rhodanese-related sulfurtransferase